MRHTAFAVAALFMIVVAAACSPRESSGPAPGGATTPGAMPASAASR